MYSLKEKVMRAWVNLASCVVNIRKYVVYTVGHGKHAHLWRTKNKNSWFAGEKKNVHIKGKEIEKKAMVKFRSEQGSNLRGETPLDFESNALTTRPSLHAGSLMSFMSILKPMFVITDQC